MIAAFMAKAVASGTAFEDVAARRIFSRKHGHPQLRVPQLRYCDESRCNHADPECLFATCASTLDRFVVRADIPLDGLIRTTTLGRLWSGSPLLHEIFTAFLICVELFDGDKSVVWLRTLAEDVFDLIVCPVFRNRISFFF